MNQNNPPIEAGNAVGPEPTRERRRWSRPGMVSQPFHRAALACFDAFCQVDNQQECYFNNPSQGNPFCLQAGCRL